MVFTGLFGNALYFRSLRKRLSRNESFGGTDGVIIIAMIFAFIVFGLIFGIIEHQMFLRKVAIELP